MGDYSSEERAWLAIWYATNKSFVQTRRIFHAEFGKNRHPSNYFVQQLYRKLIRTGSVMPEKPGRKPLPKLEIASQARSLQIQAAFHQSPKLSIRRASLQLNESYGTIWRVMRAGGYKPYKIQFLQKLNPEDKDQHLEFSELLLLKMSMDPFLLSLIIFSDEAIFQLDGKVNKQNCRIWATENPHAIQEIPLHSPKVMVWAALWSGGMIGPFFFQDNVTGESYLEMLETFFFPQIAYLPERDELIFMQDGAPPHFSKAVRDWLDGTFPEHWIGRRGPIEWPPRSPDLTPLDFSVWGFVKEKVYQTSHNDLDSLKNGIRQAFELITPDMVERCLIEFTQRLEKCMEVLGDHIEHL